MIIDLFAGPGGWDEGLKSIGRTDVLGIENDEAACRTAEEAGHQRMRADIAAEDPWSAVGHIEGLIGSPPCPGFSAAGKGLGRKDFELLLDAIDAITSGRNPNHVLDDVRARQNDERSALTLEPLRWAIDTEPMWIALEQVPSVLPLWQAYAPALEAEGYSVWTGYLHAEQYGVPQARKRAALIATRNGVAAPPTPTHSKYHKHAPSKLDPGVLKWVSMAEGIGRGMTHRPSMTVTGGGASTGGAEPFGNAARQGMLRELEAGRWFPTPAIDGERGEDITWPFNRPSPTIVGSFAPDVVAAPGYRKAGDPPRQKTPGSVRITLEEAAVLQSFRADYPWDGGPKDSVGKKFQQVGNAVPPLLAAHTLSAIPNVARIGVAA